MDEHELRRLMYTAQLPDKGPFVIRYPRGRGVLVDWKCPLEEIPVGKGRKLKEGNDLAVITIGPIGNIAARAMDTVLTPMDVSTSRIRGTCSRSSDGIGYLVPLYASYILWRNVGS